MARVLFVIPNLPYPLATGGHLRDWQILNLLVRRGIRPALLWFGAGEGRRLAPDAPVVRLAASVAFGGDRVEDPDRGALATAARKLGYLAGVGRTHPFAFQYDAAGAEQAIVREAERVGADVAIVRGFWCRAIPALRAAGLRVIANCPDANVRLAREMVRTRPSVLGKLGPLCNLVHVRRLERRFLGEADEVWAPTESERDEIAAHATRARCLVVPNGVDVESLPDLSGAAPENDTLLFVANYAYAPNARAAERLVERVLPVVRRVRPRARLLLVGGGMPAGLRARVAASDGVEAPGFVDALLPWYRRAAVVLLPVREGAGTLFKTLEALALGKASVGFASAYRGIEDAGEPAFVTARSHGELARTAVGLLADPLARRRLGTHARALAERRGSWGAGARHLDASLLAETAA